MSQADRILTHNFTSMSAHCCWNFNTIKCCLFLFNLSPRVFVALDKLPGDIKLDCAVKKESASMASVSIGRGTLEVYFNRPHLL